MKFQSLMHIGFYTANFDEIYDFYINKLGLKPKIVVRYKEYLGNTERPSRAKIAAEDPERIFYTYIEVAPGQFIEFFPEEERNHQETNKKKVPGYSHFALLVDDIFKAREEVIAAGITPDTEISQGPSGTYQMWLHDPDGNRFEIMQYTADSYQVVGHFS